MFLSKRLQYVTPKCCEEVVTAKENFSRSGKASSSLALIGKICPNCGIDLTFLEHPPIIVPDDLDELEWDYVKNLSLISKILAICFQCGFVATDSLTPVEARGVYSQN